MVYLGLLVSSMIIEEIISQHAEEAAFLWLLHDAAVRAPHYSLEDLARLDERIEAHLDGLRVNGEPAWGVCRKQLEEIGEVGEIFAAGVLAFESGLPERIEPVLKVAAAKPEVLRGLVSGLGWVSLPQATRQILGLVRDPSPLVRRLAIAAAAIHRRDPGSDVLEAALTDQDLALRARALRGIGELGAREKLSFVHPAVKEEDPVCRFWAAWTAALIERDNEALQVLRNYSLNKGPFRERAIQMVMRADDMVLCHKVLQRLMEIPGSRRTAIIAAGVLGDTGGISWLIEQMATPSLARVSGESFSMITGTDLSFDKLEGELPEGFEAGPTENPEDENVVMDPDEDLPWPNPVLVEKWWTANKSRFSRGSRFLVGEPIAEESLQKILRTGKQRQRAAAALELALRNPEKGLFEVRASASRQKQLLGL